MIRGGVNRVINTNVVNGTSIQQTTMAGLNGICWGAIGVMRTSIMTQARTSGQIGTTDDSAPVMVKKRGGLGKGKKGKKHIASRDFIAMAS